MMISLRALPPFVLSIGLSVSLIYPLKGQVFTNEASSLGINAYNWNGHYGAAVSTADWNNDGWADITLGGTSGALKAFVNDQGGGFQVVGLPWTLNGETKSLIWLDLDNDGDDDLFIMEETGKCGILRNDGEAGFEDVTPFSGLPQLSTEAAGVSFGDMDNDGDLDLHLCRYLNLPLYEGANHNALYMNNGDLSFTDVSAESGIDEFIRLSFQSLWWDHNQDGWQDILIINDKDSPNSMYENQGDGTFLEVASDYNLDVVIDCMSASLGDFNLDTRQDLFHTNTYFGGDGLGAKLLTRLEDGTYVESAADHNLAIDEFCWGAAWMDVDNDSDLDLFVTEHDFLSPYGPNHIWENLGAPIADEDSPFEVQDLQFEPFGTDVYDVDYLNSHVVATADFDHNGWLDFVVHNVGNHATRVWMNDGFPNGHRSISIELKGTISNRPAIGSRIELEANGVTQSRITHAGENYLSQETEAELFGTGAGSVDDLTVNWPSGLVEHFSPEVHGISAPGSFVIVEGSSPCPSPWIDHVICHSSIPIDLESEVAPEFSISWNNAQGDAIEPSAAFHWTPGDGDLTMTAMWQGQATCTVTHHVELMPLQGDFNVDGVLGNADVLALLTDLGCTETCFADLDNNGFVGSSDLLLMLTLFGATCE